MLTDPCDQINTLDIYQLYTELYMKKFAVILLAASLLTNISYASDQDKVVATYKGGEVKESQIMDQYKTILDAQPETKGKKFEELNADLQEQLARGFLNTKLVEQEGKNSNIESSKKFQDKLNGIKNQLVTQEVIEDFVKSSVNDAAIDAEYKKRVAEIKGQDEIKVSHILVDDEKKAKEVKNKLNQKDAKGNLQTRFSALAKEYSKDDGSKVNGGELGYILKGQLVPEFENKAFSMKPGQVSDPVQTQFGWHIIMVSDKRPARIPTKEEASPRISSDLTKIAIGKYFENLASKYEVKINLPVKDVTPAVIAPNAAQPAPASDTKDRAEKPATK